MKNIMLLTTALVDGGAEVFLQNLEKMLNAQGYRVYVVVNHPIDKKNHPQNYYSFQLINVVPDWFDLLHKRNICRHIFLGQIFQKKRQNN